MSVRIFFQSSQPKYQPSTKSSNNFANILRHFRGIEDTLEARKKGTAPGKFKVTVDMVAALPDDILDDLRVLINTVLLPGRGSFRAWRRRGIVPVLKPQLDNEVDNICPINLVDVFWMFIAVGH